ncbi:MAG TPA: 3'-5' exonuclease [Desulfobacterales bacterium]|nr:3'-5' exonuclease [Desulfobacterales bacterium]
MPSLLLARMRNRWIRARFRKKEVHPLALTNLTALDHLRLNQSARSPHYVVLDLETTGLSLTRDRVVSVAAFRVVEGRILLGDVFNSLVDPDRSISLSSIKIHGIVPSMVARAPGFADVFDQFLRYLGTDILVGYNVWFDLHFLNTYMQQSYGFPLQNLVLDAYAICQKIGFPPRSRSYAIRSNGNQDLDAVAKHLGIQIHERHTALGDALATAMIFQRILAEIEKKGPGRLRNLL